VHTDPRSGAAALHIETLLTQAEVEALEPEWRLLESRMVQLPFVRFDWVILWWRHFRSQSRLVRDDLFVCTFRTPAGELVGVAPLIITQRPSVGPIQFRELQFMGADPNITEVRCIATSPCQTEVLYSYLLDHLRQFRSKWWNVATLTGLPAGNHTLETASGAAFVSGALSHDTVCSILELKPSWEEFKSGLPRNIKESLRKCYNAPTRDGLSFKFRVVSEGADVKPAVHRFFELHRARSEMRQTIHHDDSFASHRSREFLLDVSQRFAERGALRIFQLHYNESVIATRIGFVCGDSLYLYFSGFDPAFARYSVMTTVVAEAIKHAIASGLKTVNLSTGRDVSKQRWAPTEAVYRKVELEPPNPIGRLKYRGYRAVADYVRRRSPDGWVSRKFSRVR
jgi:CelD/BcsL family acetyltransferase involved in cellulose biosynthesis